MNVTSYILGPPDIKLDFGFNPQPSESDASAIRKATYHGSEKSICLSVTNNNVTLETALHTKCKHL
jgi:hypothetical protein